MDIEDFKVWREWRQLTQVAAGSLLGVNRQTIRHWEIEATPLPAHIEFACRTLDRRRLKLGAYGPVVYLGAQDPFVFGPDTIRMIAPFHVQRFETNEEALRHTSLRKTKIEPFQSLIVGPNVVAWDTFDIENEKELRRKKRASKGFDPGPSMDMWDLKKWRKSLKYSQFDAAEALGVSRGAIQNWEIERYPVPLSIVLASEEISLQSRCIPGKGPAVLVYCNDGIWDNDNETSIVSLSFEAFQTIEAAMTQLRFLTANRNPSLKFIADSNGRLLVQARAPGKPDQ